MTASRLSDGVGRMFDDRFQLLSLLGADNTSKIYLALDSVFERRVVIRVLREELAADHEAVAVFRNRMQRESSLTFDNILPVYFSGETPSSTDDGTSVPYLVTQFLGGGSLRMMLDANGPLTLPQTVQIGTYAAKGLASAHRNGSFHLGLRPENILFADDSERSLRIKDFGLARALAESSLTEPLSTGSSAEVYSAPELLAGGEVDGRADVYSLALVLAECVSGSVPLTGANTADTIRLRTAESLRLPSDFGPLREVLESAGSMDRSQRPDAATLARLLEDAASNLPSPALLPIVPTLGPDVQTVELDRPVITTTTQAPKLQHARGADQTAADPVSTDPVSTNPVSTMSTSTTSTSAASGPTSGETAAEPGSGAYPTGTTATRAAAADERPPEPASDPEPQFAVVVDASEQASMYAASRPQSLGPVDALGAATPLGAASPLDPTVPTVDTPAPKSTGTSTRRPKRRSRWWIIASLVLLAALAGGVSYWWFAIRVPTHPVPGVTGRPVDAASASLKRLGFVVDASSEERRDGSTAGEVLGQSPARGTTLSEGETVHLTVSLGPTLRVVPPVEGMTRDDAVAAIEAADLVVGTEKLVHDEDVEAGTVISASVAPGGSPEDSNGQVPRDTSMDLTISDGPAPRIVPSGLIGASAEQARAALSDVQLEANIVEAYDEKAPKGQIIASSAKTGEALPRGSKVNLTMSKGPAPIKVPDVRWITGSMAAAKLEAAGFVVQGIEGSPSGMVLQTDPTPGELRPRNTPVRIFTQSN